MRICIIDRNVVSKIASGFRGCLVGEIAEVKALDRKENVICLMFSNIEGRLGKLQSQFQSSNGMQMEGDIVRGFFKKARVDSDFYEVFNRLCSLAIVANQREVYDRYYKLVEFLQDLLYQPFSLTQATKVRDEIVDYAAGLSVEKGHPIVLCALATLYGNKDAQGVLKPMKPREGDSQRENRIYNFLADLLVMVNLAEWKGMSRKAGYDRSFKFITLDKPLHNFLKQFGLLHVKPSRFLGVHDTSITYGFDFITFPRLKGSDREEFKNWLYLK